MHLHSTTTEFIYFVHHSHCRPCHLSSCALISSWQFELRVNLDLPRCPSLHKSLLLYCMHLYSALLHASILYSTVYIYNLLYWKHLHSTSTCVHVHFTIAGFYFVLLHASTLLYYCRHLHSNLLHASTFYNLLYWKHLHSTSTCVHVHFTIAGFYFVLLHASTLLYYCRHLHSNLLHASAF